MCLQRRILGQKKGVVPRLQIHPPAIVMLIRRPLLSRINRIPKSSVRYVRDDRRNLRASAYQEPPFAIRSAKRGVASKTGIHHDAGQLRHRSRRNIYYSMASSTSIVRIDKIPFGVRGSGEGHASRCMPLQVAHCHGRLSPICCPRGSDKCRSSTTNRLLKPHFPSFSSSSGILGRTPR